MRLSLFLLLAICMIVTLSGCGSVFFFGGAINPGTSSITGVVSVVQVSAVIGNSGTTVQVTFVTFQRGGVPSTIGFCGDERNRFPMQQLVRANFTPGQTCASIVTIVTESSVVKLQSSAEKWRGRILTTEDGRPTTASLPWLSRE